MTPVAEIIPGFKLPENEIITYGAGQPEYIPLPMWSGPDGMRVSRWRLTWRERLRILLSGSIWLSILTFDRPLQPVKIDTQCPLMGSAMLDEEV